MFRKIMVPVDLDQPQVAERAMEAARLLAGACGAEILVISIQPNPRRDAGGEAREEARLAAYIDARRGEVPIDGVLTLGGSVVPEVKAAAEDMGVDLIVMASHEPTFSDYLFGSRSSSVALHTACSVMVVR